MVGGGDCLPSLKGVYLGCAELSSDFPMYHMLFSFLLLCALFGFVCMIF